jgi:translation elongation factor EF-1beta
MALSKGWRTTRSTLVLAIKAADSDVDLDALEANVGQIQKEEFRGESPRRRSAGRD